MDKDNVRRIGEPSRRVLLRNGLLLGAVVAGGSLASEALTNAAQASTSGPQPEWAWCCNCSALFYYPNINSSGCPALRSIVENHGHHAILTSFNYGLNYNDTVQETNPQPDWKWCGKCQGLFYFPQLSDSYCPAGNNHEPGKDSFNYTLYHDNPNLNGGQPGWYWCAKCRGLWYGGNGNTGTVCPKDYINQPPHETTTGGPVSDLYYLFYFSKSIT